MGLLTSMSAIVSGSDVTHGKPSPEIYRTTAQLLGVPIPGCVVIEDSEPGIIAAKSAGMLCVALHSTGHRINELLQADLIIKGLRELTPQVITSLMERSLTFSTR